MTTNLCKLFAATNNADKLSEIRQILSGSLWQVADLFEFQSYSPPIESGATLRQNALIKAREGFHRTGLMTLADDTGLEIDALNGDPGVHSARYAGENASYKMNLHKVLDELGATPTSSRTARFRTVMALVGRQVEQCWEGVCEGLITHLPIGKSGFGYDPIFWSVDLRKTFSQVTQLEKNSVSHRGRALRKLMSFLEDARLIDPVRV